MMKVKMNAAPAVHLCGKPQARGVGITPPPQNSLAIRQCGARAVGAGSYAWTFAVVGVCSNQISHAAVGLERMGCEKDDRENAEAGGRVTGRGQALSHGLCELGMELFNRSSAYIQGDAASIAEKRRVIVGF
jgi:hypothetical protein